MPRAVDAAPSRVLAIVVVVPLTRGGLVPVQASGLFDRIYSFVRRYVVITDEQAVCMTLWIAHTYLFESFVSTPYLFVTSPTARAGKTRLLEVIAALATRPWRPVDPTPAVLFRTIDAEKPTLLADEVDSTPRMGHLRTVFNAGYRVGVVITRIESMGGVKVPINYKVFCPKVLAGITGARVPLHSSTFDRCIVIDLKRRLPSEPVERFRPHLVEDEGNEIRAALTELAAEHAEALRDAVPELPTELDDRAAEVWEPLLAVAAVAGDAWLKRGWAAAVALSGDRDDHDEGIAILADIRSVFVQKTVARMPSDRLLHAIRLLDDPSFTGTYQHMTPALLAARLKSFGIRPKMIRFETGVPPRRGYLLEDLAEAFARYLS
jgi:Protein of unknown function (DUF3631)